MNYILSWVYPTIFSILACNFLFESLPLYDHMALRVILPAITTIVIRTMLIDVYGVMVTFSIRRKNEY